LTGGKGLGRLLGDQFLWVDIGSIKELRKEGEAEAQKKISLGGGPGPLGGRRKHVERNEQTDVKKRGEGVLPPLAPGRENGDKNLGRSHYQKGFPQLSRGNFAAARGGKNARSSSGQKPPNFCDRAKHEKGNQELRTKGWARSLGGGLRSPVCSAQLVRSAQKEKKRSIVLKSQHVPSKNQRTVLRSENQNYPGAIHPDPGGATSEGGGKEFHKNRGLNFLITLYYHPGEEKHVWVCRGQTAP